MSFRESLLGAKDPLSQRLLGYQESAGDLRRGEPAYQTHRKRDASFHRNDRMTRGKDKPQHVIVDNLIQRVVARGIPEVGSRARRLRHEARRPEAGPTRDDPAHRRRRSRPVALGP